MIRRPPRSTPLYSSAASDVYKRQPHGNRHPYATNGAFATKNGLVMLGASNLCQQRRLWTLLERPDMIKKTNDERDADHTREVALLEEIMRTRTADEWEEFLQ